MIQMEEMRQLLCRAYPGLRDRVVATSDAWIGNDGDFVGHVWMLQLTELVRERLTNGNYEHTEALFCVVEKLIAEGDDDVRTVVLTGLVEGLQHQHDVEPKLWQPFLGRLAKAHCDAMDEFHGIKL
ncbi:DUF7674 family protein [Massilia putida]|uniref:DUF7674 family protein n=1 Tax=Massilia putida TaxID=1141883 RepID=UPI00095145EE|nr:hypothetical protein [Massilia putida]